MIDTASAFPETCLFLMHVYINSIDYSFIDDFSQDFARHGQESDSTPIVTITEQAFLWNFDYDSLSPIVWYSFLFLYSLKQR